MSATLQLQPMFEANALLDDVPALRARMDVDGYLFLRNVLPIDSLLDLRRRITDVLADVGWIEGGAAAVNALASAPPRREGQAEYFAALDPILKLEELYALAHTEALAEIMIKVLGDTAFPHPLSIARLVFPGCPELATPPHQDFPNNQGSPRLTAAWIPLADCDVDEGSLAVLAGSHTCGVLPLAFHLGPGNRQAVLPEALSACQWVGADFRLGDVVLFGALTVHRAMENRHPRRMRLSVDYRYQCEGEALTANCLLPHFGRFDWADIYANWHSDKYCYYWRDKQYDVVPWDDALHALPQEHLSEALRQEIQFERRSR